MSDSTTDPHRGEAGASDPGQDEVAALFGQRMKTFVALSTLVGALLALVPFAFWTIAGLARLFASDSASVDGLVDLAVATTPLLGVAIVLGLLCVGVQTWLLVMSHRRRLGESVRLAVRHTRAVSSALAAGAFAVFDT